MQLYSIIQEGEPSTLRLRCDSVQLHQVAHIDH